MRDINAGDPYERQSRSIRAIPVHHRPGEEHLAPHEPPRRRRRRRPPILWIGLFLIICIIAGVLLSTVFAGATVNVSPRIMTVTPPSAVEARLNPSTGTLGYQIVSVTKTATTTVKATGTKKVSRQASGLVTIYNAFAPDSQRLIANTRFQAPDGKIYRIRDSVSVPGMTGTTPGQVNATIYADSPGTTYNRSGTTTFVLPGFKGDPRYEKFSAKTQGDISGGFVGTEPSVADADLAKAKTDLQKQVDTDVRAAAGTVIPEGYVAIPGSLHVTFSAVAQSPGGTDTAVVTQSGTASGAVVQVTGLAMAIATKAVPEYKGEAVLFDPTSELQAAVSTTTDLSTGAINIGLSGTAKLVWQFDPNAVKQALLGKPKSQFQDIVESFAPAIRCTADSPCEASIRPFWKSSFPSDPAKIKLVTDATK